jgi:hypothetical protein
LNLSREYGRRKDLKVATESCEGINRELERERTLVGNHILSLRSPTPM